MRWMISHCRALYASIDETARRLRGDERGVSFVVTAISATVLLGFAGLAVDIGMWQVQQRNMQGTADQAALAGAVAYRNAGETGALGDSTNAQNAAYAVANQAGFTSGVTLAAFNNGGSCTNDGCLQVTITQNQPRYFTGIFASSSVPVTVSAVGTCQGCGAGSFSSLPNGGDACVMALDASGSGVITASGTPTMSLSNCNLYNNSPNTSATVLNGGAVIQGCTTTNACGAQAFLAQPDIPSGNIDIPITTQASPAPDPFANLTPPTVGSGTCSGHHALPSLSTSSTAGGTYCAPANGPPVNLSAGTYVIVGGFDVHSGTTITGTGVTLYVLGGGTVNGGSNIQLTAPSTGAYAGLAIWYGDSSAVTYDGNNSTGFSGAMYAPKTTVTWGGTNATGAHCTRLIAGAIDLHGTPAGTFDNSTCPDIVGPSPLAASGVTSTTPYNGAPVLVQ